MPRNEIDEIKAKLRIDEDNMDLMLVEHSEYFFKVAERVTDASARRDTLKLEMEAIQSSLDNDIRTRNARDEIKMTETALSNAIKGTPRYQEAQRKHAEASRVAADLGNLKEAFQQRSYMLRELNQRQIASMYNLSTERGTSGSRRNAVAERARVEGEVQREERRTAGRSPERYRSRDSGD